jgi:hypothetical protein
VRPALISCASSAGIAPRCSAAICGSPMISKSPITAPAGNLPPDHPVTAPSYSARRSTMAKQLGLGRKPSTVDASPARSGTSAVG